MPLKGLFGLMISYPKSGPYIRELLLHGLWKTFCKKCSINNNEFVWSVDKQYNLASPVICFQAHLNLYDFVLCGSLLTILLAKLKQAIPCVLMFFLICLWIFSVLLQSFLYIFLFQEDEFILAILLPHPEPLNILHRHILVLIMPVFLFSLHTLESQFEQGKYLSPLSYQICFNVFPEAIFKKKGTPSVRWSCIPFPENAGPPVWVLCAWTHMPGCT